MLKCTADGKIEDTGPLTKKRMETVDEEFLAAALDFIDRQQKAGQAVLRLVQLPLACTSSPTSRPNRRARPVSASIPTEWSSTTGIVGRLLKKLDDLGIADNTIVVYGTDNGAEVMSWPDGGTTAVPRREGDQLGGRLSGPRA